MTTPIIITCPFLEPAIDFGGPTEVLRQLAPRLVARDHRVRLVGTALGVPPEFPRDTWVERPGGYHTYYASPGSLTRFAPHPAPRAAAGLASALAALPDAILHLNLGFTFLTLRGRRLAGRRGIPYVLTPHGVYGSHNLETRRLGKRLFFALFERRTILRAAFVQALVAPEAAAIRSRGAAAEQVRIIPNGVDLKTIDQRRPAPTLAARCGFAEAAPVVLSLSRIHRTKGLDLLIPAFAACRREVPDDDWQLVVAGPDGGWLAAARALAFDCGVAEQVHFAGVLDEDQKYRALADARIFALTSYAEGMPLSVLEACASRTPVLITDRCNLPEVALQNAGRVCRPELPDVQAGLLEMMRADGQNLGRQARRLVEANYTWERVAEQLSELYEETAARRQSLT